jgi:hypothetical protein
MTENETQRWITFSEELFHVGRHAKEAHFEYLSTGSKSGFIACPHDLAWAPLKVIVPTRRAQKIQAENV